MTKLTVGCPLCPKRFEALVRKDTVLGYYEAEVRAKGALVEHLVEEHKGQEVPEYWLYDFFG